MGKQLARYFRTFLVGEDPAFSRTWAGNEVNFWLKR
jgi:hypothetical protein